MQQPGLPVTSIAEALQSALRHHNSGNLAEAERLYREILKQEPHHAESLHLLGVIAFQAGRADAAQELIQQAIALNPSAPEFHSNLGNVLKAVGSPEEAMACYRRALALRPDFPDAYYNIGNAHLNEERFDEAIACFQESLRLRPNYAPACVNLGNAFRSLGRIAEAIDSYDRVPRDAADFAESRWNRAIAILLSGDLARGWEEYECRWNLERAKSLRRNFKEPVWDGSPIDGRTILIHAEQGYGDTIQFIRYAPLVATQGARVVVECQAHLVTLISKMRGIERVVAAGDPLPAFDFHVPLLSLPRIFGTTLENVPAPTSYLHSDPALAHRWTVRLRGETTRLKVGLVWAGGTSDPKRDCSLAMLGELAGTPDTVFVSLQKGTAAAQAVSPPAGMSLIDANQWLNDFADTAAAISQLDLIVSVDTSVLHLAGALGRPAWGLLRFAPDWRWLLGRTDNPWYPSVRLFRQELPGSWQAPISAIAMELVKWREQMRK